MRITFCGKMMILRGFVSKIRTVLKYFHFDIIKIENNHFKSECRKTKALEVIHHLTLPTAKAGEFLLP